MPEKAPPSIPLSDYAARRKKVRSALATSIGVVFAGEPSDPLNDGFTPHPHFTYLTGIADEPGAVLVLDPKHPVEARREMLFLRPIDPELDRWDGYRDPIAAALRAKYGIKSIFRTGKFPRFLAESAHRAQQVACLHPLAWHDQPVSPDLALFRRLAERIPGLDVSDRTAILARLRSVKSRAEVAMIQHAVDITAHGYRAALDILRPGISEFDVQEAIEHAYRTNGSRGPAYGTIAGGGINSTVLHYSANDRVLEEGDLICIDSGASYGAYGADVTRTYPVGGTFTRRQRDVYQIVLQAEEAAIRTVKAGATLAQVDAAARAVITAAGFGDCFIHGTGHHLGIETHDITPDGPLKAGNVITIEPGIYIPDERIGIRIEDDVVVTTSACRVLSAAIPKRAVEIEKLMAR